MPIYDYHCDHCGHAFSAIQRFADDAIAECPSCGKLPRRLRSNPALVFKGSGWYKTDSRGPEKKDQADTVKDAAGKDTGKDTGTEAGTDKTAKDKKEPKGSSEAPATKTDGAPRDTAPAASKAPAKTPGKGPPASS